MMLYYMLTALFETEVVIIQVRCDFSFSCRFTCNSVQKLEARLYLINSDTSRIELEEEAWAH